MTVPFGELDSHHLKAKNITLKPLWLLAYCAMSPQDPSPNLASPENISYDELSSAF